MRQVFLGDLSRLVCPALGQVGLADLVAKAKAAGKPITGSLSVLVAGRERSVTGRYDPAIDELKVEGHLD
ncbi:hypothetical protein A3A39_04755 [Candidatus Kaiserbacteria bacterium RIFCSPLOWO2_01_FULL_54_13]|uniref:Uncharacterized protein n=1 Tax=Candidatus Kaiserbacteria bacterium RIFCSPLOWO2_01_FULL_54_13 TaxID=1798512 RepID=A0A1F6F0Q8_9BACT|nr:MAG: hypothetical protein A3A39_04755 [Candidatus Kaiserbacteria bacterium RIFCSPLOWO2_01_FULL_54_13]